MSILSKQGRKEWKEKVRRESEKATASFLTKFFRKFGIDNATEKFLAWAENHRKTMFAITMSFLGFVTIVSIAMRPDRNEVKKETIQTVKSKVDSFIPERDTRLKEAIELMRLKARLEEIKSKRKLTEKDSLMIKQFYNKLKNYKEDETD